MMMNNFYSFKQIFQSLKDKVIIRSDSSFTEIDEGIVHDVYRIISGKNAYYLKIRLDHFKTDKKIKINPIDITHEQKAIDLVNKYYPGLAPKIIYIGSNFLLLENISRKSDCLYNILYKQKLSIYEVEQIGIQMANFHKDLSRIKKQIRSRQRDLEMYNNYLYWRFGIWNNENVNNVVKELKKCKRQLIYGDFNPKNIVLFKSRLRIFDWETMHQGNTLFDVGFFAGHILLSFLNRPIKRNKLLEAFFDGYLLNEDDLRLAINVSLATLYYRIKSGYSYRINFYYNKKILLKRIDSLLSCNKSIKLADLSCL